MKKIRVVLNGKGAANPVVRAAINQIRDEGQPLEVRCTWEGGDAARFAQEALSDGIEVLVLDEADHMFDLGFLPDVRRILQALPNSRQNLLFSATMPREIRRRAS